MSAATDNRARLVREAVEAMERLAHDMADGGDVETAWTLRGVADAIDPEATPEVPEEYASDYRRGYAAVDA